MRSIKIDNIIILKNLKHVFQQATIGQYCFFFQLWKAQEEEKNEPQSIVDFDVEDSISDGNDVQKQTQKKSNSEDNIDEVPRSQQTVQFQNQNNPSVKMKYSQQARQLDLKRQHKDGEQYEPGINYDDTSNLPQLKQMDNKIRFEQDLQSERESIQVQQEPKNKIVVMKQRIEQKQEEEDEIQEIDVVKDQMNCEESSENGNQEIGQSIVNFQEEESEIRGSIQNLESSKQQESENPEILRQQQLQLKNSPFPPLYDMTQFPNTEAALRNFLTSPLPQGRTLQCYIRRSKTGLARIYPIYHMYTTEGGRYMLTAKKVVMNSTSNYIITFNKDHLSTKSNYYLGKVRSNFMGTEFILYDNGLNPKKTKDSTKIRCQLGAVYYESNLMSTKGPRKMKVLLPKVGDNDIAKIFMPLKSKEGIQYDYKSNKTQYIEDLVNKPPRWNEKIQAFVLNFYGRVDKPSVKNFQLMRQNISDKILLQFGRVDDVNFNVDFTWPISPLQALQICVSSFDFKFACE